MERDRRRGWVEKRRRGGDLRDFYTADPYMKNSLQREARAKRWTGCSLLVHVFAGFEGLKAEQKKAASLACILFDLR